jgi:hypothetical protein
MEVKPMIEEQQTTETQTESQAYEATREPNQLARELGKLGASKGGKARANVLSPEERTDIARKAVRTRWAKVGKLRRHEETESEDSTDVVIEADPASLPHSMFRGKITIGDVEFECHVLNNFKRVLAQREVVRILTAGRDGGNLIRYLKDNPLIDIDLILGQTVEFKIPGFVGVGYEGTLLIDICERYLEAREQGVLRKKNQLLLAAQAEIVIRACAKVGIIALIDEATGYQKARARNALQIKFQAFIADDLQEWARMFPEEFWLELARLEGIHYSPRSRPLRWGKYVMMFVYDAIDSDVGKELRKKNPNPHFLKNHHQWLKKFGKDKVRDQILQVVTIMKLCNTLAEFKEKFARVFKKSPLQMSFDDYWTTLDA